MSTSATLGGLALPAMTGVGWSLTPGTQPHRRSFEMRIEDAEALLVRGGPITLEIRPEGYDPLVVEQLWPLGLVPVAHPDRRGLIVVDLRYFLHRTWIERTYNLRRRSGDRRRLAQEGQPVAVQQVVDDVAYHPGTLFPRTAPDRPWGAFEVLEDVLQALREALPGIVRGLLVEDTLRAARQLPVQDVSLAGSGDAALAQALALVVGAGVLVDPRGNVVVYDARSGREAELLAQLGPPIAGPALDAVVSHARARPGRVHVLFERDLELALETPDEGAPAFNTREADDLTLENVLQLPDPQTQVGARSLAAGTWVGVIEAFDAWRAAPDVGQITFIDQTMLRLTWFAPSLLDALIHGLGLPPSEVLARRLAAARGHYRQTYRLVRRLNDRLAAIRPERVALLDEETGTRAPAAVYADWVVWYTIRSIANSVIRNPEAGIRLMDNLTSFVNSFPNLTDARPAPAEVQITDEEQGVLHVAFRLSPWGDQAMIAPGRARGADNGDRVPVADPRESVRGPGLLRDLARLDPAYRAIVILTVRPLVPADETRFHRITVEPAAAEAALGVRLGPSLGPAWTIRIPSNIETARFPWEESRREQIKRALGISRGEAEAELGDPVNQLALQEVATAAAAQVYSQLVDRIEGVRVTAWSPRAAPLGNAAGVAHELHPDGQALTSVALPPEVSDRSLTEFLPEGARRRILRLANVRRE